MAAAALLCYATLSVPCAALHLPAGEHKLRQKSVYSCQQHSLPGHCPHGTWCAQAVESPRWHWGSLELVPTYGKVWGLYPCAASTTHKGMFTPPAPDG